MTRVQAFDPLHHFFWHPEAKPYVYQAGAMPVSFGDINLVMQGEWDHGDRARILAEDAEREKHRFLMD